MPRNHGNWNIKPEAFLSLGDNVSFLYVYCSVLQKSTYRYFCILALLRVFPENERQLNVTKNISTWFFEVPESTKFSKYNYFKISSILSVSIAINSLFLWLIAFIS